MRPFIMIFIWKVVVLGGSGIKRHVELCSIVMKECTSAMDCGAVLHNFDMICTYGGSDACSDRCLSMSFQLYTYTQNVHASLVSCDCQGSLSCERRQQKLHPTCLDPVTTSLADSAKSVVLNCNLARNICEAEATCQEAMTGVITMCKVTEAGCSTQCDHAITVLSGNSRSSHLMGCTCDRPDTGCLVNKVRTHCSGHSHAALSAARTVVTVNWQITCSVVIVYMDLSYLR